MTGADMLAAWLAESPAPGSRHVIYIGFKDGRYRVDIDTKYTMFASSLRAGSGETLDAAMRAAVEAARKGGCVK